MSSFHDRRARLSRHSRAVSTGQISLSTFTKWPLLRINPVRALLPNAKVEPAMRFELMTSSLPRRRSTPELRGRNTYQPPRHEFLPGGEPGRDPLLEAGDEGR